ncbi:hydantoinase/oxoprolinase family protein [Pseudonocardia sp. N23]|uniref:hydantoinase/oxoprolinase family protein n=1 Tax=Pseudonocardia sp. N23 TaxID=1987376 RepID=UPI000BFC854C|nr:hydantoinase/oxoprolinase family protein [Pseudonocardia sp. N23]GAY07611.1 N-methylhydantoinase A [Pseudonocardia sp. N23]
MAGHRYTIATDMGGTFTDLVLEDRTTDRVHIVKSPTVLDDPVRGILDAVDLAATGIGIDRRELLAGTETFVHGTTRALNAILTGTTARTAFLTTRGHPDVLLFREGGRVDPFDFTRRYPDPLVPRALTWEVVERVGADGAVVTPLDEAALVAQLREVVEAGGEAIAVCLLWSIANPVHEVRIGELIEQHAPGIPYTLSHRLNPIVREYRRACSTVLDASLKPLMTEYLEAMTRRLSEEGLAGRLLIVTSGGGVMDSAAVAAAPVHVIGSGPAMAPIAGRDVVDRTTGHQTVLVADTGGTSYDVGVVRDGDVSSTREAWLGAPHLSHMTGLPAIDIKSVGAGGGSIAAVGAGGLLTVGPRSAGARPGPVCYGQGGTEPTVTDAAVVLGYLDPQYFLGGRVTLDVAEAERAIEQKIATPLGFTTLQAAAAIMALATEHMVRAIEDTTVAQGIDPADAVLVAGGGAGGFNATDIASRLRCSAAVIPDTGSVLSAAGAAISDLSSDFVASCPATTQDFDFARVGAVTDGLVERARAFVASTGVAAELADVRLFADARYPHQVWEVEVPLPTLRIDSAADVGALADAFHKMHEKLFAISDPGSDVEIVGWRVRAACRTRTTPLGQVESGPARPRTRRTRRVYFAGHGLVDAAVRAQDDIAPGEVVEGPAIVETPVTVVVVAPDATATRASTGALVLRRNGDDR